MYSLRSCLVLRDGYYVTGTRFARASYSLTRMAMRNRD